MIVLTNLTGSPIQLRQALGSGGASLCVGLREITYTVGWHNISTALNNNTFMVREGPKNIRRIPVPDGYYNVDVLAGVMEAAMPGLVVKSNVATGRVNLVLTNQNWQLSLAMVFFLGFTRNRGWLGEGTHTADSCPACLNHRALFVHLDQVNTTGNVLNGHNISLLRHVPVGGEAFGETRTITYENPPFHRLNNGSIQELTVRILDEHGHSIDMHDLPYSVTLEIQSQNRTWLLEGDSVL